MRHISTKNLLLKKLYGETSEWENELLNNKIAQNWKLVEEMEAFGEVIKKVDSEVYSPSKTSIQIILDYSKKAAPIESRCCGKLHF